MLRSYVHLRQIILQVQKLLHVVIARRYSGEVNGDDDGAFYAVLLHSAMQSGN